MAGLLSAPKGLAVPYPQPSPRAQQPVATIPSGLSLASSLMVSRRDLQQLNTCSYRENLN